MAEPVTQDLRMAPYNDQKDAYELKVYHDHRFYNLISVGGEVYNFINIVPGNQSFQRIGKTIHIKQIRIRGSIELENPYPGPTTDINPPNSDIVRVTIVLDKQCNTFAPGIGRIFYAGSNPISPYNDPDVDRFDILSDKTFVLQPKPVYDSTYDVFYAPCTKFYSEIIDFDECLISRYGNDLYTPATNGIFCVFQIYRNVSNVDFFFSTYYTDS